MNKRRYWPVIFLLFSLLIISCSGRDDPRNVVKEFVGAIISNDSTAIESMVNWEGMIKSRLEEMSPEDSSRSLIYYKAEFFNSLIDSGNRRLYYLNSQIVVGKGKITDDRAEVELSFIGKDTGIQNYTKVGLLKSPDGWKIIYLY
ncbi:MAG: hypothetical protein CO189_08590 [candidate division Zixibacteria bacterium CG_4_9_14_3_um_filter_46_8]|nr:MAG: hypothetical protein CO189_08590 [candidate division Zixibacteria bacterium CG_4_9_14_3_um_filter_46_8]